MKNPMDGEVNQKPCRLPGYLDATLIETASHMTIHPFCAAVDGDFIVLTLQPGSKLSQVRVKLTQETAEQLFMGIAKSGLLGPNFHVNI